MENSTLAKSLKVFDRLVEATEALKLPKLSSEFSTLPTAQLKEALIAHRITSKYEVPSEAASKLRKTVSINKVLELDSRSPTSFNWRDLESQHRRTFLHAQGLFREFFRGFQHTYKLRFPSGETFVSARGLTDLYFKLSQEQQWHISPELVDYAVEIIIRNRALLNVVRHRYRKHHGQRGVWLLRRLWAHWSRNDVSFHQKRKAAIRFMFKRCVRFTRISRVTTVPKNNKEDRVITCEALWTMICQLSYGYSLRVHMKKKLGIDLDFLQNVHRALIRAGNATIDLRTASDLNLMCVLRSLWPESQVRWLNRMRTGIFYMENDDVEVYHPLRMFAPMGCGCTFEVMTLTLLLQGRVFDKGCSVFGDDIIISSEQAPAFCRYLETLHWAINEDKSFIHGNFRESCGAYASLETQELLLSYDFKRPEDLKEVFILAHKLVRLVRYLPKGRLRKHLIVAYMDLLRSLPRVSWVLETEWTHNLSAPLRDDVLFVTEAAMRRCGRVVVDPTTEVKFGYWREASPGSTPVSACLAEHWQRPVVVNRVLMRFDKGRSLPDNPIGYAAIMKRGSVYEPTTKEAWRQYPCDAETGTPLNKVPLATVLMKRDQPQG